jgi:hypothetical protein
MMSNSGLLDGTIITVGSLTLSGSTRTNPTILTQTVVVGPYRLRKVYFPTATTLTITLPYTDTNQKAYYLQ